MAEYEVEAYAESGRDQRVEYRSYPLAGHSRAERAVSVAVSGKVVHKGWASDGKSYAVFCAIVAHGLGPDEDPMDLISCGNCGGSGGGGGMDPDVWIECQPCGGRGWIRAEDRG